MDIIRVDEVDEYVDAQKKINSIETIKQNKSYQSNRLPYYSENTIALQSTATYLGTIFWKSENNINKRNKK